ncbi:hypothetical protein NDU88_005057 [Pleurodeles waltl]|uniref:Uncharacterized protein n=1 Tax=Pleurodeles waltl TaxID=8319 RepID=A0AAV7M863_PLEWA|nr:hypothetical protein NDU88_005057 [Pleurodeles waltl]
MTELIGRGDSEGSRVEGGDMGHMEPTGEDLETGDAVRKERSVKDMLSKPTVGKTEADNPGTGEHREEEMDEDTGAPSTRSFLEGLFASLWDEIQAVKRDLSQDLKVVRRELEEVGKSGASERA